MKKFLLVLFLVLVLIMDIAAGCDHNWVFYSNGTGSFTGYTDDGDVVKMKTNTASDGKGASGQVTYTMKFYGMGGTTRGTSYESYQAYVDLGYKLIYIGGQYYHSSSNNWSEKTNISSYLYPSYINYFRPAI